MQYTDLDNAQISWLGIHTPKMLQKISARYYTPVNRRRQKSWSREMKLPKSTKITNNMLNKYHNIYTCIKIISKANDRDIHVQ